MCVCCRCEFAPIKTMEKEVFISTEATSQMSSVYLSGCNVFLYQTLALQRYTFSFWQIFYSYEYKRSVFSVSFFLSFSNSIQKFFDAFVHDNSSFLPFSLLFELEFSFVVIFFSLYWACRYIAMACKCFGSLDESILTKDIMDVILQEVTRILFLCVFAIFCFNIHFKQKWLKMS